MLTTVVSPTPASKIPLIPTVPALIVASPLAATLPPLATVKAFVPSIAKTLPAPSVKVFMLNVLSVVTATFFVVS